MLKGEDIPRCWVKNLKVKAQKLVQSFLEIRNWSWKFEVRSNSEAASGDILLEKLRLNKSGPLLVRLLKIFIGSAWLGWKPRLGVQTTRKSFMSTVKILSTQKQKHHLKCQNCVCFWYGTPQLHHLVNKHGYSKLPTVSSSMFFLSKNGDFQYPYLLAKW